MAYPQKDSEPKSHPFTPISRPNIRIDFEAVMNSEESGGHDIQIIVVDHRFLAFLADDGAGFYVSHCMS